MPEHQSEQSMPSELRLMGGGQTDRGDGRFVRMVARAQRVPFVWWLLVVWVAWVLAAAVAGAVWGLGLHCEAGQLDDEFPCPVPANSVGLRLLYVASGAIGLAVGIGVVAYGPAIGFSLIVAGLGWMFRKTVDARSVRWPWITLAASGVALIGVTAPSGQFGEAYPWVGLATFLGAVGLVIAATGRQWRLDDSDQGTSHRPGGAS